MNEGEGFNTMDCNTCESSPPHPATSAQGLVFYDPPRRPGSPPPVIRPPIQRQARRESGVPVCDEEGMLFCDEELPPSRSVSTTPPRTAPGVLFRGTRGERSVDISGEKISEDTLHALNNMFRNCDLYDDYYIGNAQHSGTKRRRPEPAPAAIDMEGFKLPEPVLLILQKVKRAKFTSV